MASKALLLALVLACAAASVSAIAPLACQCPSATTCENAAGTCGLPPSLSLSFTIPGISRAYGYTSKKSNVADAAACRTFCGTGSYYEYVAAGGPTFLGFLRRPSKDCVCYSSCKNYAYWLSFPTVSIINGYTSSCPAPK